MMPFVWFWGIEEERITKEYVQRQLEFIMNPEFGRNFEHAAALEKALGWNE